MDDISLRADICSEAFPGELQIRKAQLPRLTSDRHSRALPQQLDDATGNSACQFKYVVDRSGIVDDFFGINSQLCKKARDEAT